MARPTGGVRHVTPGIGVRTETPGLSVDIVPLWMPAKGLDYWSRLNRVQPTHAAEITNLKLDESGILRSRPVVEILGSLASGVGEPSTSYASDTFTDTNGTNPESHTPDTGLTGWDVLVWFGTEFEIQSNRLTNTDAYAVQHNIHGTGQVLPATPDNFEIYCDCMRGTDAAVAEWWGVYGWALTAGINDMTGVRLIRTGANVFQIDVRRYAGGALVDTFDAVDTAISIPASTGIRLGMTCVGLTVQVWTEDFGGGNRVLRGDVQTITADQRNGTHRNVGIWQTSTPVGRYIDNFNVTSVPPTESVRSVAQFMTGEGKSYVLRFKDTSVQRWDGTSWASLHSGMIGTSDDRFTVTTYGGSLLFSNGKDGIFVYNPTNGTVTEISESHPAKYLTTFTGRVIASDVRDPEHHPERVRWSAKNNSEDWTGEGSGYEDLLSTPGGHIDQQMGVWPITDTIAIMLRSRSVWQMTETGVATAPFRFGRLLHNIGTESPYSAVAIPGGVIFMGIDDVYVVGPGDYQAIGQKVRKRILDEVSDLSLIVGDYDPIEKEYVMLVPGSTTYVYRYSFDEQGWTRQVYPTAVNWLTYARGGVFAGTIDGLSALAADIDGLTAISSTIDGLGIGGATPGGILLTTDGGVMEENSAATQDNMTGVVANSPIEARSGMVTPGHPLERSQLIEMRLEYETEGSQTLFFDYSTDGGSNWSAFGATGGKAITATSGKQILRARQTVSALNIQVRVRSATIGKLRIHGLYLRMVRATEDQIED